MKSNEVNVKNGFTIVELLVVATIVGLLSAAGMVSYVTLNRNARDAKRKSDLEQVRAGLELYRSSNPTYPNTNTWSTMVGMLTAGNFLSNSSNIADPKPAPYNQYRYRVPNNTSCSGYDVCADLENVAGSYDYCLCNP